MLFIQGFLKQLRLMNIHRFIVYNVCKIQIYMNIKINSSIIILKIFDQIIYFVINFVIKNI